MFIYVAESQFSNMCNVGVVFYTQSVKDCNFCRVWHQLSVQLCITSASIFRSFTGQEYMEGTSSYMCLSFFPLLQGTCALVFSSASRNMCLSFFPLLQGGVKSL